MASEEALAVMEAFPAAEEAFPAEEEAFPAEADHSAEAEPEEAFKLLITEQYHNGQRTKRKKLRRLFQVA